MLDSKTIKFLCKKFNLPGDFQSIRTISNGHINSTYKLYFYCEKEYNSYILQRVNTYVFKNPVEVMENIVNVTEYIRNKLDENDIFSSRSVLCYNKTDDGKYYYMDDDGGFWRCSRFIDGSMVVGTTDNLRLIEESGKAFGEFQQYLSDYPVKKLFISIPHFHNTIMRFEALKEAYNKDECGRAERAKAQYERYLKLEEIATRMYKMQKAGELPLRVTHNDTKCNNVLFDENSYKHLAVIDLDTVMPGLVGFDFGDAIRYIANNAAEDERDVWKIALDLNKFKAYCKGFIGSVKDSLTENEKNTLALGAITMTVECGIRFLTDFLQGDKYFNIEYSDHNFIRSRCQLLLAEDMIKKLDKMKEIVSMFC